jgi:thiamine-phosphate pyrophosphorylase
MTPQPAPQRIHGLYAITPDQADTRLLANQVAAALAGGVKLLQYRNKPASTDLCRAQLATLKPLCDAAGCLLIVNDHWRLAAALGIPAVHLGRDDEDEPLDAIRAALGPQALIGISCYASLERAARFAPQVDYLAFGAMFASGTKPQAPPAPLSILMSARQFMRPVVAIGGIDARNAAQVIAAGADAVAVIGGVFAQQDITASAQALEAQCRAGLAIRTRA